MRDDHLRMRAEARLDSARLPLPEDDVPFAVAAADPLAIWGEPDLTGVSGDGVTSETLVPRLTEVVRTIYENLVIQ